MKGGIWEDTAADDRAFDVWVMKVTDDDGPARLILEGICPFDRGRLDGSVRVPVRLVLEGRHFRDVTTTPCGTCGDYFAGWVNDEGRPDGVRVTKHAIDVGQQRGEVNT